MNRQPIILISTLLLFLASCRDNTTSELKDGARYFSYENGKIAFTYFKNNIASIYYTTDIDSVAQQLTFPKTGWDFTYDLSRDLSKILYINYPACDFEICNICIYDLKSKQVDTLLKGGQLITDACISNDNKEVYFTRASEFENYSPMASKAPHGVDIYKISIETKNIQKLTNLNEYSIYGLKATFSDTILGANIMGLAKVSTITGETKEINIDSPRNPVSDWFTLIDLKTDSMMYEAPYELYKHNLKTNKSEFILRCPDDKQFGDIQTDYDWKNILFSNGEKIYLYNVPNKKLTEVNLKIE